MTNGDTTKFETWLDDLISRMDAVPGWFSLAEGRALFEVATTAFQSGLSDAAIEVGSYCGRSTVVLGGAAQRSGPRSTVHAIDPLVWPVGYYCDRPVTPSVEMLKRNLETAGVASNVNVIQEYSFNVVWDKPLCLLFIDGWHEYEDVSRDFHHFEPWVRSEGFVAFHDCPSPTYPDVERFVDEQIRTGRFSRFRQCESLAVLRKRS